MEGWISIHRKIVEHWIWENEKYLKAWLWFLIRANHEGKKVLIGGQFIELERGQFITSIQKIAAANKLTYQNTRTLLKLLKKDEMINKLSTNKLTIITICNYDHYQSLQQTNNTQTNTQTTGNQQTNNKQATTDNNVNNNDNNENNENNNKAKSKKFDFVDKIIDEFIEAHKVIGDYEVMNKGKERAAAGTILKKYKEKYPESSSDETLIGLRAYFEKCVKINDPWLKANMSLPIIVNKFSAINKILNNGNKPLNGSKGATVSDLIEIGEQYFGDKK